MAHNLEFQRGSRIEDRGGSPIYICSGFPSGSSPAKGLLIKAARTDRIRGTNSRRDNRKKAKMF